MRQILVAIQILLFILIFQSCSPKTELTTGQSPKKRNPNWIKGFPSDFENWYEVGKASIQDSISAEDYALGLMNEKLRLDLEKIFITNFELQQHYLGKITQDIIDRRLDIINSLKKIDSSFINNGNKYALLSISKKEYYNKIAQRFNNYNIEQQISLLTDDLIDANFSILSSIIENLVIHFDHVLINSNKKNIGEDILNRIRRILNDYNNRITFSFEPAIINSLPITNEGEKIIVSIYDNKSNEKLDNLNVIQDYGDTFDLIREVNSSSGINKIKIPSTNDGDPYSFIIKIDYETILNSPFFDLFLTEKKEFRIAVISEGKKVFLHETIQSLNSNLDKSVFNDSIKSCFESKYGMTFVSDNIDADLSMFFEVSSNENVRRNNRKQPFKSEVFFIVRIEGSKTRKMILDYIVASQEAYNYDFIERASIAALKNLAHEALSVVCYSEK